MKRYKKLLVALGAVAALLLARQTGLDQGLIDDVVDGVVEAVVGEEPSQDARDLGDALDEVPQPAPAPAERK